MEDTEVEKLIRYAKKNGLKRIEEFQRDNPAIDVTAICDADRRTLLHYAAGCGSSKVVGYLLDEQADINAQDFKGFAPLHNSCCYAHYEISEMLIDAGADVNLRDVKGRSPLYYAVTYKMMEPDLDQITERRWKVIRLLLERGAYLKPREARDCFAKIKNANDRRLVTDLHLRRRLELVISEFDRQSIIDDYVSPEEFFEWIKLGDDELDEIRLLATPKMISSRLENCDNITPLHRAAGYNHVQTAELFMKLGARVDATDCHGRIPLHNAAQYGHIEMIKLLIKEGSDLNFQDVRGFTPLHIAASNETFAACLLLKNLGANLKSECHKGRIPYDLADSEDVKEVLRPKDMRFRTEVTPSSSGRGLYVDVLTAQAEIKKYTAPVRDEQGEPDELMLDSHSDARLFTSGHQLKIIQLDKDDHQYQEVKRRMFNSIVPHEGDFGGLFSTYEILSIEYILHEKIWSRYRSYCQYISPQRNEKLLFHGSMSIDEIQYKGFDERHAQSDGMFGAGIYFAEHSSKSNQYVFGFGKGCLRHNDKSCYECERKMIYAQVALGRVLESRETLPHLSHAPPDYNSVKGNPDKIEGLNYPEYAIYSGYQAYPLFVIRYRIKP